MQVKVLQQTTFARDIDGNLLVVGKNASVDPSLGNQWACLGIVEITDHGPVSAQPCHPIGVPDENGHIYYNDPDRGLTRDYEAERRERRRKASAEKQATKTKEKTKRVNDQRTASGSE